jgi:hypothetical protein
MDPQLGLKRLVALGYFDINEGPPCPCQNDMCLGAMPLPDFFTELEWQMEAMGFNVNVEFLGLSDDN